MCKAHRQRNGLSMWNPLNLFEAGLTQIACGWSMEFHDTLLSTNIDVKKLAFVNHSGFPYLCEVSSWAISPNFPGLHPHPIHAVTWKRRKHFWRKKSRRFHGPRCEPVRFDYWTAEILTQSSCSMERDLSRIPNYHMMRAYVYVYN